MPINLALTICLPIVVVAKDFYCFCLHEKAKSLHKLCLDPFPSYHFMPQSEKLNFLQDRTLAALSYPIRNSLFGRLGQLDYLTSSSKDDLNQIGTSSKLITHDFEQTLLKYLSGS